jgi:hypothetical protein
MVALENIIYPITALITGYGPFQPGENLGIIIIIGIQRDIIAVKIGNK